VRIKILREASALTLTDLSLEVENKKVCVYQTYLVPIRPRIFDFFKTIQWECS